MSSPVMFVICYPSVWFRRAKMENTCHSLGDRLSGRKRQASGFICTWHRWWISLKVLCISLALTCVPPPHLIFFLYLNIIWNIPFLLSVKTDKKKKTCLDSCTAAIPVIDRDVTVFILKFWIKQTVINLPVCSSTRGPGKNSNSVKSLWQWQH